MTRRELLAAAAALSLAACVEPVAPDPHERVTEDGESRVSERDAEPREVEWSWA